jgi:hypothetical protein
MAVCVTLVQEAFWMEEFVQTEGVCLVINDGYIG